MRVSIEKSTNPLLPEPVNRYRIDVDGVVAYIDAGLDPLPEGMLVLVTHYHWDHTYGLAASRGLRVCMPTQTLESLSYERALEGVRSLLEAVGYGDLVDRAKPYVELYKRIEDSLPRHRVYSLDECPLEGVEGLHCPGHSGDHHCYIIGGSVFLGDNYVPYTTSTTLTSPLDYMESMHKVLAASWSTAYPGHGSPTGRKELVEWLNKVSRRKLARMLEASLRLGGGTSLRDLLHTMYPQAGGATLFLAARNLIGYVRALEDLGLVRVDRGVSPWIVEPA